MNITKTNQQIIKQSTSYKIIIPEKVEAIIRETCHEVWQTEWSGILFYKTKGSFGKNNLVVTCVDILPMDIGSVAYTVFDVNPDIIQYQLDNDLLECHMGLIHSHNNMSTFFSATDINTLCSEGIDRNHFVSLIVNNQGTYSAAITRNVKIDSIITDKITYNSFKASTKKDTVTRKLTRNELQYFNLDIVKPNLVVSKSIKARLQSLKKEKELSKIKYNNTIGFKSTSNSFTPNNYVPDTRNNIAQQTSLFNNPLQPIDVSNNTKDSINSAVFSKETISGVLKHLITGNVTSKIDTYSKVNILISQMVSRFDKTFVDMTQFSNWASSIVDYIIWETTEEGIEFSDLSEEELNVELASNILEALEILPINKYIAVYKELFKKYC